MDSPSRASGFALVLIAAVMISPVAVAQEGDEHAAHHGGAGAAPMAADGAMGPTSPPAIQHEIHDG